MEPKARPDDYEHANQSIIYVSNNIPGPGIDIDDFESEFTIGCDCRDSCKSNCSCVRGISNYHEDYLNIDKLNEIIVECNSNCLCGDNCANKLIQRGPIDCLEIVKSGDKGFGLGTKVNIEKNRFICEYAGEIIGIDEAKRRFDINTRDCLMNYILVVSEHISDRKIITCIDPQFFGNIGRYCNHSCRPNAILVPVRVEKLTPRLCIFARRDIKAGEEITFDYAGGFVKSEDNLSEIPCLCGEDCCLGYLPHFSI